MMNRIILLCSLIFVVAFGAEECFTRGDPCPSGGICGNDFFCTGASAQANDVNVDISNQVKPTKNLDYYNNYIIIGLCIALIISVFINIVFCAKNYCSRKGTAEFKYTKSIDDDDENVDNQLI
mmetsp:Transcript_39778/g.35155  ORF Transcript_39778/g.35155 Transcript_39778/m.35155 type:complete len:123 (+) Transcript_39778:100-468(+)